MRLRIVTVNDVYVVDHLPRLRTLVRRAAEVDPADALLVTLPGDFLSPSILSSLDGGRGMVDCLDALGVTHVTFGNHEDDLPTDDLVHRIGELRATWLATNVRELVPALPAYDVIEVGGVRVGLIGVVMNDPGVYRRAPFGGGPVPDANATALEAIARLTTDEGCALVVPLTHQFIAEDRALARAVDARRVPVILGGHEHGEIVERVHGVWIVKAKADAVTAGVVDIELDDRGVHVAVRIESVAAYPEDPAMRARADGHMSRVRELDDVTILALPPGASLSSVGTRSAQTSLGTLLASRVRDALGAEGGLFNGGGIRGNRVYEGRFTYGALKTEVPFDNEMVVVPLPGRVLAAAIAASRIHAPVEFAGFLQVDDRMVVDPRSHALLEVDGEPFEPERDYRIAMVRNFLAGLDRIEPLVQFAQEHPERVPMVDSGRDVRVLLATAFAVELWRGLGGFDAVDGDGDGRVTREEVEAALAANPAQRRPDLAASLVVTALDTNDDRVISPEEAAAVAPKNAPFEPV